MTTSDETPTEHNEPPATTTQTTTTAAAKPKRPITRWLTPLLAIVAALVIGLFGGILIGQNTGHGGQNAGFSRPGNFGGGQGGFQQGGGTRPAPGTQRGQGGGNFGGFTAGTIQSIDGDSIVIKKPDGTSVTVKTTDSTKVTKTSNSSVKDLKSGETVTVRGTADSDGNIAADSVSEGAALAPTSR